jgi:diacylglycerol kinase family enzyme
MNRASACAVNGPFIIVMNADSGRQDSVASREAVSEVLREANHAHDFWIPESPSGLADVAGRALAEARRSGGAVVAAGGDGTINTVAGVLQGSGCPLGLLPQGTFNYFGRAHGVPQDPAQAARALLRARVRPVQVGQVNGRIFLVNASLGLYPQLLEDRESYTAQFGRSRWVAFAGALMTLLRWRGQLPLRLQTRAGLEMVRTTTLFVGNNPVQLERLGLPEAEAVKAGFLAVIAVHPMGPRAMLGLLLLVPQEADQALVQ